MEPMDHCDEETCTVWNVKLKICSHCGDERYCSTKCQKKAWPKHREIYGKPDVIDGRHFLPNGRVFRDKNIAEKINACLYLYEGIIASADHVQKKALDKGRFAIITIPWDCATDKIPSDIEMMGINIPTEDVKETLRELFPEKYESFLAPFYNFDFSNHFLCKIELHNLPPPPPGRENDCNHLNFFWARLSKTYIDKLKSMNFHK